MRQEEGVRKGLQARFSALQSTQSSPQPNLATLLPGIMAEARRPAQVHINRTAFSLIVLLAMVTLVPLLRNIETAAFSVPQGVQNQHQNIPHLTESAPDVERATQDMLKFIALHDDSSQKHIRNTFDLMYASPVPPPQVTRVASQVPPR